jgi:prepilin-type N-terminal cleavage/methylation domain-containing protein
MLKFLRTKKNLFSVILANAGIQSKRHLILDSRLHGNDRRKKGFTLIELLVTLSIFVIVGSVVLFGQSQFNSSILLTNLAYDMALTIRQAQVFGAGGKITTQTEVAPTYGVHIDTVDNKSMIFFYDYPVPANSPGYRLYDAGTGCTSDSPSQGNECVDQYNIKKGNSIKAICDVQPANATPNSYCPSSNTYNSVDITFTRPEPDANIFIDGSITDKKSQIQIDVGADSGTQRHSVIVTNVGQILIRR